MARKRKQKTEDDIKGALEKEFERSVDIQAETAIHAKKIESLIPVEIRDRIVQEQGRMDRWMNDQQHARITAMKNIMRVMIELDIVVWKIEDPTYGMALGPVNPLKEGECYALALNDDKTDLFIIITTKEDEDDKKEEDGAVDSGGIEEGSMQEGESG